MRINLITYLLSLSLLALVLSPAYGQVNPNVITFEGNADINLSIPIPAHPGCEVTVPNSFNPSEGDQFDNTLNDLFDCYYGVKFFLEDGSGVRTPPTIAEIGDQGYDNPRNGVSLDPYAFSRQTSAIYPECNIMNGTTFDLPDVQGILGNSGETLGCFFLTDDPGVNSNPSNLIVEYSIPTTQTSGYLLDIDVTEKWQISAYDSNNSLIGGPIVICSNGAGQTGCTLEAPSGRPGTQNEGIATYWEFNLNQQITEIRFEFIGNDPNAFVGLGFDNFSATTLLEIESCDDEACQANVLNISTGLNHNTGSLYAFSQGDAFWQLLSVPSSAGNISVPRPAFVISPNSAWGEPPNSRYLSGQPINNWDVNGGPYVMQRCFCICEPGEYVFDMEVWVDDEVDLELYSNNVLHTVIGTYSGFDGNGTTSSLINTSIFLEAGDYCLRAGMHNVGSVAMGLNIEGTIDGAQMLTSVCCNPTSSLVGVKFNDLNCNGFQDANEPGLSGWQIVLDYPNQTSNITTTDADGYYSFVDLDPGIYSVSEVFQGGWTPSLPTGGAYNNITIGTSEVQILNFGNCEGESCVTSNGLNTEATSTGESDFDCCWNLDFFNSGNDAVYGIRLTLLNGIQFEPGYTIAQGFFTPNFSNTSLTITNEPLDGNPLPFTVLDLIDFCMVNVNSIPQYMTIEYLGEDYERVICEETLLFDCPITNGCLEYTLDSLVCDTLGYKYTIDFTVPPGTDFPIGYIKFNLDSQLPAGAFVEPIGPFADPAESGHVFPTPLVPGDQVSLMYIVNTPVDLFGDTLCVIITAHDDIEERLCCFAYDGCLPYPLCDPCPYVSSAIRPVSDVQQIGYCCFDLLITDTFTVDPGAFTSIEATICTPGVTFDGLITLPALLDGWTPTYDVPAPQDPTSISWTHSSGVIPSNLINYNLFDFCVKGTTSTDSIDIKINWLNRDSVLCSDTLSVYCPDCLTVVNDSLYCDDQGNYLYQFSFVNHSIYDVNAIRILDESGATSAVVGNPGIYMLGTTVPPGGTYGGSIPVQLIGNPGDTACFDIVLRQIIGNDINITCCYATHCVELLPCDELSPLLCPDPAVTRQFVCDKIFDPICGCNNITYANICYAQNAGVDDWIDGPCDLPFGEGGNVILGGQLAEGGVQLNWQVGLLEYDFFVVRGRWPGEPDFKSIATILYGGSSLYEFLHLNSMPGLNEYQILGINNEGLIFPSNIVQIMITEAQALTTVYAYPNPAREQIFVTANRNGHATMELISPEGQVHQSQQADFNGSPIPFSTGNLAEGVFIIRLRFDDGEIAQRRIVKLRP